MKQEMKIRTKHGRCASNNTGRMNSIVLESQVNETLLQNGWDYNARKRVTFMLRNKSDIYANEPT